MFALARRYIAAADITAVRADRARCESTGNESNETRVRRSRRDKQADVFSRQNYTPWKLGEEGD